MKKIITMSILLLLLIGGQVFAADRGEENKKYSTGYFIPDMRRGCCSHHGGVCGCSVSGRTVCCDGTLSPSCGC